MYLSGAIDNHGGGREGKGRFAWLRWLVSPATLQAASEAPEGLTGTQDALQTCTAIFKSGIFRACSRKGLAYIKVGPEATFTRPAISSIFSNAFLVVVRKANNTL